MRELASESSTQGDPDLRTQRHDDQLLDRLGRGEPVEAHDEVEAMLSAWRQDLPVAGPPDPGLLAAITAPGVRPKRRMTRASLGIAASIALLSGGVMVGAAYANPDSPLWPVTRFVYGNLAESRMAQSEADHALADARAAAAQGRYTEAARLLAAASRLAGQVDEPTEVQRLRAAIDSLLDKLPPDVRDTARPNATKPTESLGVETPPLEQGDTPRAPTPGAPAGDPGQQDNGNHPGTGNGGGNGGGNNGGNNGNGQNGGDNDEDAGEQVETPTERVKPSSTKVTKTRQSLTK
jgi:hypothetical protein